MSNEMFALLFILGAAGIAVWTVIRFPRWAPEDFRTGMIHVGLSLVAMYVLRPELHQLTALLDQPFRAHLDIFALMLPAFVYRLVSVIWLLRLAQGSLGSAIR